MARQLNYFAYGANMHPVLLGAAAPGCHLLGLASLSRHSLRFHKRSGDPDDPSAKCNAFHTGRVGDVVHGVVFQLHEQCLRRLEERWGEDRGYRPATVRVLTDRGLLDARVGLADADWIDEDRLPFDWYVALIGSAARIHGLPAAYQARLRSVATVPDPDARRSARQMEIARGTWKVRSFFRRPRA